MTPSLSVPTDNIYKFASLFGLALLIASTLAFVAQYNSALEAKARYVQAISLHGSKEPKTEFDRDMVQLNEQLLKVAQSNESAAVSFIGGVGGIGLAAAMWGFWRWRYRVQVHDDSVAELQLAKLRLEVASLRGSGTSEVL